MNVRFFHNAEYQNLKKIAIKLVFPYLKITFCWHKMVWGFKYSVKVFWGHPCFNLISYSLNVLILNIEMTHLNQPWSRSVAVTFNTVVPGPWFSITWASNSARWNTGASSFTSITCTVSTWEVESWGIPWSSATMVKLKSSCSSRSKAFRMEREPTKEIKTSVRTFENLPDYLT